MIQLDEIYIKFAPELIQFIKLRNTSIKVFAMKKYLIVGAWALVAGLFVTSCTHDDDIYQNGDIATQKTEAFQKAFVKAFGQTNQNWGFYEEDLASIAPAAARASRTRSVDVNKNEWQQKGYNVPEPISPDSREYEVVMNYFRTTPNPQSETVDIHNYFIQNVGYTDHNYYYIDNHNVQQTITNPGENYMNWIFCGPGNQPNDWNDPFNSGYTQYTWNDGDEHINNYNAGSGEIQHILYTGSEYFGFNDSYGTDHEAGKSEKKYGTINRNFTIRFIDVDGVVGCYVGLNYETGKTNEEGWHLDPDNFFDDRVLKLVAAEGSIIPEPVWTKEEYDRTFSTYGTPGRVFCEDLGDVSYNDIDYNDVVFDAQIEHRTIKHYVKWFKDGVYDHTDESLTSENDYAHIKLLAAGGTMPLTVAGTEVHDAFGVGQTTMVNTVTDVSGSMNGAPYVTREYVELDEIEGISSINDIEVIVNYSNGAVVLETTPGLAPHKILVLADYVDDEGEHQGTAWAAERQNLGDAYPDFKKYVASPQKDDEGEFVYDDDGNLIFVGGEPYAGEKFWEGSSDPDKLFGSWKAKNCGEARYTTKIKEDKGDDNRTIYVIYYKDGEGYDISTPLYFTNSTQLTDKNISANDIIRVYGTAADPNNWRLILSDGNSKALSTVGTSQGAWTGYYEFVLTESMVSALKASSDKAAMIISGVGLMVTEVDLIKAK